MFKIIPFKKEHIIPFLDQTINLDNKGFFLNGPGSEFESEGTSFTGTIDDIPVVCGGIKKIWDNRGIIWCMFNEESKMNFVPVFRGMRRFLADSPFDRTEVCIPYNFEIGKRRAELLGFKLECARAEKFLPNGTDCALYALVRK